MTSEQLTMLRKAVTEVRTARIALTKALTDLDYAVDLIAVDDDEEAEATEEPG